MTHASPIFWKTKQISRVCHSNKDAETLNLLKMVDDSILASRQLELLLYGDIQGRIPVQLFTDSESTLESVASTRQISTKSLRNVVVDLKERLIRCEISSYSWLPTQHMWADVLTKEMLIPDGLKETLMNGRLFLPKFEVN